MHNAFNEAMSMAVQPQILIPEFPSPQYTTLLGTCYYGHNFINTGEVCTSVLFIFKAFGRLHLIVNIIDTQHTHTHILTHTHIIHTHTHTHTHTHKHTHTQPAALLTARASCSVTVGRLQEWSSDTQCTTLGGGNILYLLRML